MAKSQRPMVAVEVEKACAEEAKDRQRESGGAVPVELPEAVKGDARDKAAEMLRRLATPTRLE